MDDETNKAKAMQYINLALVSLDKLQPSKSRSCAITHLEEAEMWLMKLSSSGSL